MAFTFAKQAKTGATAVGTLSTVSVTSSGNWLALVGEFASTASVSAPTDSKSNTWTQHPNSPLTLDGNIKLYCYYAENATVGASHTFTWALSAGTDNYSIAAIGLSGRATSSTVENTASNAETSAVTSHTLPATGTISDAVHDVVVAFGDNNCYTVGSNDTWTAGAGLTLNANAYTSDGRDQLTCGFMYAEAVGTGGITAAYTSGGSTKAAKLIMAVKAAAAGGSGRLVNGNLVNGLLVGSLA